MPLFLRVLMLLLFAALPLEAQAGPVGFQHFRTPDGVEIGIWYPAQASADNAPVSGRGHPLVVMSHGTGGSYDGHSDTAIALAEAGFVVAALTHPGDNWQDQSRVLQVDGRPRALSALIDYMLSDWSGRAAIDGSRVGAFGFSAGGFTVLTAAGGVPDLALVAPHCAANPRFFDCGLVAANPGAVGLAQGAWVHDDRIKAVVAAAPALGFAFGRAGLSEVRMPVQLWKAGDDRILPAPFYADAVHDALPGAEFHVEAGAGHFDFLKPCPEALAKAVPVICTSAPGFDRAAFHARFNVAVVGFFVRTLR